MPSKVDPTNATPFVCDMQAIPAHERPQHLATARQLFQSVESIREMPDGYAFKLPAEAEVLMRAAEFIRRERLCCPFFGFALDVEPEGGSMWLRLSGREGVKEFIRAEMGEFLGETADFASLLSTEGAV